MYKKGHQVFADKICVEYIVMYILLKGTYSHVSLPSLPISVGTVVISFSSSSLCACEKRVILYFMFNVHP